MAQNLEQWVNLTKHEIFTKDGDGATLDRCGKITVEAMFEKANIPIGYKVKVTPVGGNNATYTKKEMHRNPNFRMTKGRVGASDDKHVLLEDSIQLPAAGGNEYIVEAKDSKGNIVKSPISVIAKRKLYYQVITMDAGKGDVESTTTAYSLADRAKDLEPYHVKLLKAGSDQKMKFIKTLHEDVMDDFYSEAKKVYTLDRERQLRGFAAVFSNYITDPDDKSEMIHQVTIGTSNPMCRWDATHIYLVGDYPLWYGLDDDHDKQQGYLRSDLQIAFTPPKGSPQVITVSKKDISPHNKTATYGGYTDLKIRITPALQKLLNHPVGTLDFYIAVNTVAGWTLGFRVPLENGVEIVTVARRVSFEDAPRSEIPNTWKHEIGHRLGMVAYGNKDYRMTNKKFQHRPWTPNAPGTVYGENRGINNQGHAGPHCSNGTKYHAPGTAMGGKHGKWTGKPLCVMFGADETDTGGKQGDDFCPLCKPIVRKLDLSLPPTRKTYNSV